MTQNPTAIERPFTGQFWQTKDVGIYQCKICSQRLFMFSHKYNHATGYASFWNFISKSVAFKQDQLNLPKVTQSFVPTQNKDVKPSKRCVCSNCGSHLGLTFQDGPPPFFKRFSINSQALIFTPKKWGDVPLDKKKLKIKRQKQEFAKSIFKDQNKLKNMQEKLRIQPGQVPLNFRLNSLQL